MICMEMSDAAPYTIYIGPLRRISRCMEILRGRYYAPPERKFHWRLPAKQWAGFRVAQMRLRKAGRAAGDFADRLVAKLLMEDVDE